LSSPLLRWVDFRMRYVDQIPRPVIFSDLFPKKDLPKSATNALHDLINKFQSGEDVNPYQGRGLTLRNDTSGESRASRTDLLWADWSILHFHLSDEPIPASQYYSRSADYLLFCIVGGNAVLFIDILRHPDKFGFAEQDLINTIRRSWPEYFEGFRINGVLLNESKSNEEIHTLRESGIAYFLTHAGSAYMPPGMGVTSASTAGKATLAVNRCRLLVRHLAEQICEEGGQFAREMSELGVLSPEYSLALTKRGLAVYESNSKRGFLLPQPEVSSSSVGLTELSDYMSPSWVLNSLRDATLE